MIIVSSTAYPTESVKEIAKRFLEAPELPSFVKRLGPYVSTSKEQGILTLSLYELENARLAEGLQAVTDFYSIFLGVPGFKYEARIYLEVAEALKTIGMG